MPQPPYAEHSGDLLPTVNLPQLDLPTRDEADLIVCRK